MSAAAQASTTESLRVVEQIRACLERTRTLLENGPSSEIAEPTASLSPLKCLVSRFSLSTFESDVLVFCAGVEVDPQLAGLVESAQPMLGLRHPTFQLLMNVLPSPHWSALMPQGALRRWKLVELVKSETLTSSPLRIDENVLHFLMGVRASDERLEGIMQAVAVHKALPQSYRAHAECIVQVWSQKGASRVAIQLLGNGAKGKMALASAVCALFGLGLRRLSADYVPRHLRELHDFLRLVERDSTLNEYAVIIDAEEADPPVWEAVCQLVKEFQGFLLVCGPGRLGSHGSRVETITIDKPSAEEQSLLWRYALGEHGQEITADLDRIPEQFSLDPTAILDCADRALRDWESSGGDLRLLLWDVCRSTSRPALEGLARRIETRATWRDLVLPQGCLVPCKPAAKINPMSKAVVYSVARVVDAEQFVCLDADMIVLGSLLPLFATLEACPESALLAVREGNGHGLQTLGHALWQVYGGSERDQQEFLSVPEEAAYALVVNDGLFAGSRAALLALDGVIRSLPRLSQWVDLRRDMWWRNQFAFNLALAKLRCGVELDGSYNVQLHAQDVQVMHSQAGMSATWRGRPARVLHRSGVGRRKYSESMGRYARVADPLAGSGGGKGYEQFLKTLRGWVGRHGTSALAWSFYGTSDAKGARVKDPEVFPLLAALHYLVRSNGCVRVLECGTAKGVSAACLASAVAHRENPRVVTFDPFPQPEREELWAALPASMRDCIEPRPVGSLEGMTEAIERNESFEAALLDSIHTKEHVWQEFQLAARLVCPSGLILIHDPRLVGGTVEAALERIESEGYGVTRLWCAAGGVSEDDGLGLALIENRRKHNK